MLGSCFQAQNPDTVKHRKDQLRPVTIELMAFHKASPNVALREEPPPLYAHDGERFRERRVSTPCFPALHQKSHARKLAAPMAMPRPKTIPARAFLLPPSPKANMSPPTTMAIKLSPSRNGSGERLLQHVYGLQPRACVPCAMSSPAESARMLTRRTAALRDG